MQRGYTEEFIDINPEIVNLEIKDNERPSQSFIKILLSKNKVYPDRLPPLKRNTKTKRKSNSIEGFKIVWKNLSFIVENSSIKCCNGFKSCDNGNVKVVLRCLNGYFKSGELTAVMGPSGAGKSTLLGCVCGQKTTGVSGNIKIIGNNRIKAAIIPQHDYLLDKFTVKESLIFASKVKNCSKKVNHNDIVNYIVNLLNLETCVNTECGKCSGGQRKRISIALELVSKPNILILDEPTSGLDSSSCYQTIKTLKDLTQQKEPMAIVATIHQPSAKVFNMFNKIYVISHNGQCIYHGPPEDLIRKFSIFGLECPKFHNPSDYILEIASGEHGNEAIAKMATQRKESIAFSSVNNLSNFSNMTDLSQKKKHSKLLDIWLLFMRCFILIPREPHLSYLRIVNNFGNAVILGLLFGNEIGHVSGCPPTQKRLYESNVQKLFKDFERDANKLRENFCLFFYSAIFLMFNGIMSMVLSFTKEVNVFMREYTNGWYSVTAYYISKTLADLPFQIFIPALFMSIVYYMTEQEPDLWRYYIIISVSIAISIVGQSHGIMISALFPKNMTQAAFAGAMTTMPLFIFSGFLIRYVRMPWYLKPFSVISYPRFGFESYLIALYGFNRCPFVPLNNSIPEPSWFKWIKLIDYHQKHVSEEEYAYNDEYQYDDTDHDSGNSVKKIITLFSGPYSDPNKIDHTQSLVMTQFDLSDDMLYSHLINLGMFIIIAKVIAFILLYWKASQKN